MPMPSPESSQTTQENADRARADDESTSQSRATRPLRRLLRFLLLCTILAAGHLAVMWNVTQARRSIDWDEFGWLAASDSTFRLMFLDRTGGAERWHQGFQVTTYGAMNPSLVKVVMGFTLYCWGYDLEPPPFFPRLGPGHPRYDQLRPAQRRLMAEQHIPYVMKLRWLVLFISTACAVALFFVGRAISGPVLGGGAYITFVFTPLVKDLSFAVYSDNLLLLMTLLSVLATVRLIRWWATLDTRQSVWRIVASLLLIAVLFGATVSTKYNGALVVFACALAVVVVWMAGGLQHRRAWQTAMALLGTGVVAFGVFVLLNPQLHEDVFGRIAWSVRQWSELIDRQQSQFQDEFAITTLGGRIAAIWRQAVLGTGPLSSFLPMGAVILGGLGLVVIAARWIGALRHRDDIAGPSVLIVWALVVVLATTVWLPLNWPRYYLPLVPVFCLLQAVPIEVAWRFCARRFQSTGGREERALDPQ